MKKLTLAAFLLSASLYAGQGYNMPSFSDFDADGNGKITQTEFEKAQQARMAKQAESGKMMRNAANAPKFSDIDSNGDGVIDSAEFEKHKASHMSSQPQGMGMGQNR